MADPITVVVPTRERANTLGPCLETILAQDSDRLSVLVSDNASSPATREVVESFADPRIRYVNTGERLSMSHNYEFALSHVTSGWIVMVGDDDGLIPGTLEPAVQELEARKLQVLACETCFYNWPGAAPETPVRLTVPLDSGSRVFGGREALDLMLKIEWHEFRMPQTYTGGIVHADIVNKVRDIRGTFFQSQIPDVFSGYAICSTVDHFLFTQKPFAIAGRSSHSTGAALFKMEKTAFLDEGLIPFHSDFPLPDIGTLSFSMPAMIYEAYTQAAYLHGNDPSITKEEILARMMALTEQGQDIVIEWGRQYAAHHGINYEAALAEMPAIQSRRKKLDLKRRIRNTWGTARVFEGELQPVATVKEAADTAAKILRNPPNRVTNLVHSLVGQRNKG